MLLIIGLGATRERGFLKPLGWRTIPYGPQSVGHCSLQGGRASSLSRKSTGQGEGRLTHCSTPQGLEAVLEGGGGEQGTRSPWVPSSCVPLSGGLCQKPLRVLEGSIHHACLTDTRRQQTRHKHQSPSPGLAPQTSRCTKKSQSPLSPFSGQSTGRWGLPRSPESWWLR